MATTHRCILRCLTQLGFEASKPHACMSGQLNRGKFLSLGTSWRQKKKCLTETVKWCERTRRDGSVSSAIESDDRPHLSPEHCHLLPAVITRLLRRCSPQHLREFRRNVLTMTIQHKFESCSRAWIHVDTLKITAKGQGKDSSASQSQWERTSRYPFVEWSKEKNRTLMAPVIARSTRRSV